ncbi:MAG TPA: leucyl/phenylalanyl-tRNA--protein transferase [Saprospiraceae bacterium]|nr:leucyl/phenylalanyl-tRNA--protein transferase [Saprospiraceae bacterium]
MKKNEEMSVFLLHNEEVIFPHPQLAGEDGLLAVGGDLSLERLLSAYRFGIFPWYNEDDPVLWWSPDPRFVVLPGKVITSKSMRQEMKKFRLTLDHDFEAVIRACSTVPRKEQDGTWITEEMTRAYLELHRSGYAHSFETWKEGCLVGGLYGVSLGRCFFGESMFSLVPNASKYAFIRLSQVLEEKKFRLIDCQVPTDHLKRMGCKNIERTEFLQILRENNLEPTFRGSWSGWV